MFRLLIKIQALLILLSLLSLSACRDLGKISVDIFGSKEVSFSAAAQIVFEESGTGSVTVSLGQAPSVKTTIDFEIVNGTATSADYVLTNGQLVFEIGETSKIISFSIVDDLMLESDETFSLKLVTMTRKDKIKSLNEIHLITISDNDLPAGAVLEVSSSLANGAYSIGTIIPVTMKFSQIVLVNTAGGAPRILLETGTSDRYAYYLSGSGTDTLTFHYTVQAGDASSDLQYFDNTALDPNGSTIQNSSRKNMNITLPALAAPQSLGQNKNLTIDTTAPTAPTGFSDGIVYFSSTLSSPFSQIASTDVGGSGIAAYEFKMGTSLGGNEVSDWTNTGNVLWAQLVSSFSPLVTYYTSIRAVDNAGNRSAAVMGDGWASLQQTKVGDFSAYPLRDQAKGMNFGFNSALSEDGLMMAVGLPNDHYDSAGWNPIENAGSVMIYSYSGGEWHFMQKITAPTRSKGMNFGFAVSLSNNRLVVGAPGDSLDQSGLNSVTRAGAIYVFDYSASTWSLDQKLTATGVNSRVYYDELGTTVIHSNNEIFAGSSNGYDQNGANNVPSAGALYNFRKSGSSWSQTQKIVPAGTNARRNGDYFGTNCQNTCLSFSSSTLVVGAWGQDYDQTGANSVTEAGAAWVFVFNGVSELWEQEAKVVPTGTNARRSNDGFGRQVAHKNNELFISSAGQSYDEAGLNLLNGSGAVFAFTRSAGVWSQTQKIVETGPNGRGASYLFGQGLSFDGTNLFIGSLSPYDATGANPVSGSGGINHYTFSVNWTYQRKFVASSRQINEGFGQKFSFKSDKLIGSIHSHQLDENESNPRINAGAIFTFILSSGDLNAESKLVYKPIAGSLRVGARKLGYEVALSDDGITMATTATDGSFNTNEVWIYTRTGSAWNLQQKINYSIYPTKVALSNDTLVISYGEESFDANGANLIGAAGIVHVYTRSAGVWSLQQKISPVGPNSRGTEDFFGKAVAIEGDRLLVSSNNSYDNSGAYTDEYAGAVFYFERVGSTWTQIQKFTAQVPAYYGQFGTNLDFSGNTAVVSDSGKAVIYDFVAGNWTYSQNLPGIAGTPNYVTVAIDGNQAVVGDMTHALDGSGANPLTNAGAVWTFAKSSGVWSQTSKIVAGGINGREASSDFGFKVSLSGNLLAVGAPNHSTDENGGSGLSKAGSVYLYQLVSGNWIPQQRLVPTGTNARNANDNFGISLKVKGRTLAVGAQGHAMDLSGTDPSFRGGSVFIYSP